MSASTTWYVQNGTATGTPAHGTESSTTSCDWKSVDDNTTSRGNAPINAGDNSYHKYLYLRFTGTFNQISAVKFAHTGGSLGTGLVLFGKVTSTYATPTRAYMDGFQDMSSVIPIASGMDVLLSTTGPNGSSPSSSATSSCYTQYLVTMIQTSQLAAAGDSSSITLTVRYNEN